MNIGINAPVHDEPNGLLLQSSLYFLAIVFAFETALIAFSFAALTWKFAKVLLTHTVLAHTNLCWFDKTCGHRSIHFLLMID